MICCQPKPGQIHLYNLDIIECRTLCISKSFHARNLRNLNAIRDKSNKLVILGRTSLTFSRIPPVTADSALVLRLCTCRNRAALAPLAGSPAVVAAEIAGSASPRSSFLAKLPRLFWRQCFNQGRSDDVSRFRVFSRTGSAARQKNHRRASSRLRTRAVTSKARDLRFQDCRTC